MFDDRDLSIDLFSLGLCVLTVFLALALLTHDSADPSIELARPFGQWYQMDVLSYPTNPTTQNVCGRWGALASAMLLDGLGFGAYFAVASLGIVSVFVVMRSEVPAPIVRTVGWLLVLFGVCTIASMMIPWSAPGTIMGAGGSLGALGSGLLHRHFAGVGGFVVATGCLLAGLMLSTDYVVLRFGLVAGSLLITMLAPRGSIKRRRKPVRDGGAEEQDDEYQEESADSFNIRIRGQKIAAPLAPDDDEEDDDEYEEEMADEYEEDEYDEGDDEESEGQEETDELEEETTPTPSQASGTVMPAKTGLRRGTSRRRRLAALRIRRPPEVDDEDRETVMERLDEAAETEDPGDYELPHKSLLAERDGFSFEEQEREIRRKAEMLNQTFASFGYDVRVVDVETGPVIAQYEVELEAGLRLNKITALADDLAIALRVPTVRIVAPIPGKNTVGIEVPNDQRQLVRLREVMEDAAKSTKKMGIPVYLGKDVSGKPLAVDLATLPHLLIAGRTGTGKSVCLNAIIASILMTRRPDEVRMLMIDPKMVELSGYKSLPHLMHPVVTDMRKAEAILAWAVEKMQERYAILARAGVRHMNVFNQLSEEEIMERLDPQTEEERQAIPLHMPYIVIVADEMADLMLTAGKEVETHIIRLAQKSRAVGIHLILATQKPTVDVITGLIKSNLPARLAFQVASRTDSRVVLDEMGADKLLGNGDMLFLSPRTSTLVRGQATFLSDDEINSVVASASRTGQQNFVSELVHLKLEDSDDSSKGTRPKKRDELYENAVEVVIGEGRGSVSLLQRALGIGYGRAARLIDFMAEDGIVGPYAGSQAREVVMTMEQYRAAVADGEAVLTVAEPQPGPTALQVATGKLAETKAQIQDEVWDEQEPTDDDPPNDDPPNDDIVDDEEAEYEEEDEVEVTAEGPDEYETEDEYEQEEEDDEIEEAAAEPNPIPAAEKKKTPNKKTPAAEIPAPDETATDESDMDEEEDDEEYEYEYVEVDEDDPDEEYEYEYIEVDEDDPDAEYEDGEYEDDYEYEDDEYEAESA